MTLYWPTSGCLRALAERGITWPDVAADLQRHSATVTPCRGYETRVRVCAETYQAYCEPGHHDGQAGMLVVGVRPRVPAQREPHTPVVGVEAPRPTRRRRGGSGTRWPTTWTELRTRIETQPGLRLVHAGKHLVLTRNGARIAALPLTASDHRALLNTCQVLAKLNVDVRR